MFSVYEMIQLELKYKTMILSSQPVIHAAELNEIFPYIDIDNL